MFDAFRINRLNDQIAKLTAQRDSLLDQIAMAKESLDATCCICNNIETMEEYGVPYYDDSLDEQSINILTLSE